MPRKYCYDNKLNNDLFKINNNHILFAINKIMRVIKNMYTLYINVDGRSIK